MAGEVALHAAHGLPFGLAFSDAPLQVRARLGVALGTDDDRLVECTVELAVAAAAEPVAGLGLSGRGLDRRDPAEAGKGCFAAATAGVGPG